MKRSIDQIQDVSLQQIPRSLNPPHVLFGQDRTSSDTKNRVLGIRILLIPCLIQKYQ